MTTEEIYQKYIHAMQQVTGDGTWVDWGVVRLGLRLAVQDAHAAGLETCSDLADDLAAIVAKQAQAPLDPQIQQDYEKEIAGLDEQLAEMDADNGDLRNRLQQAQKEIDRLTHLNTITVDVINSVRPSATNGNGTSQAAVEPLPAPPQATWWYENLDDETNDWRLSIEAGRRTWRQIPKAQRLLIFQAVARFLSSNGAMPTQAIYDENKPVWMPTGTGIASTFACNWADLLTVTSYEVPA